MCATNDTAERKSTQAQSKQRQRVRAEEYKIKKRLIFLGIVIPDFHCN